MRTQTSKTQDSARANPISSKRTTTPQFSHPILQLQQQLGNQAVQRLLQSRHIQAKLTIGAPNDKYEQEADRVADQVMRMPNPTVQREINELDEDELEQKKIQAKPLAATITPIIQRRCSGCEEEVLQREPTDELEKDEEDDKKKPLQAKEMPGQTPAVSHELEGTINSLRGGGQALLPSERKFFEPRFDQDFSQVRVHTNAEADVLNRDLNARAFTTGSDIFFRSGEYRPGNTNGRELLAHELTHVVQQRGGLQRKMSLGQPVQPKATPSGIAQERAQIPFSRITSPLISRRSKDSSVPSIQLLPAAPRGSTRRFCGFGITTHVPGFIQNYVTSGFNVGYKSGCSWILLNAWKSLWELYDSRDRRIDSATRTPLGDYTIGTSDINSGTPSDGTPAKWSLWYQVTKNQPWYRSDPDAYPHDYVTFDVYSTPLANHNTSLITQTGPQPIWQDYYTAAANGATAQYTLAIAEQRSNTASQTTTTSLTVGGSQTANAGASYNGLEAGFSRTLSMSMTQTIARSHSVTIQNTRTFTRQYNSGPLVAGQRYSISAYPLYHYISGSANILNQRNGILSAGQQAVTGGIRSLVGLDVRFVPVP